MSPQTAFHRIAQTLLPLCTLMLSSAWAAAPANDCIQTTEAGLRAIAYSSPPQLDPMDATSLSQIDDRLWAVNATNRPPADGVLRPRLTPETMSPTVHFALGQLVPPHANGSWEKKKFAFLVPLKDLYSRAANLMALDTFIVGDYKLPRNTIIVAPKGETSALPKGLPVFEYDPAQSTLRQAVDSAIENQGGISLATPGNEGGDYTQMVKLRNAVQGSKYGWDAKGPDLNQPDFLKPVLDRHPWISFGTHNQSVIGEAGRLGQISYFFQIVFKLDGLNSEARDFLLAVTKTNLKALDSYIGRMPLDPEALESFRKYRREADELVRRMEASRASRPRSQNLGSQINQMPFSGLRSDLLRMNLGTLQAQELDAVADELEMSVPGLLNTLGGRGFLKLAWVVERDRLRRPDDLKEVYRQAYQDAQDFIDQLPESSRRGAKSALGILVQTVAHKLSEKELGAR